MKEKVQCTWIGLTVLSMTILLFTPDVWALTGFARKYQTTCITCHESPPRLNKDGEAFRLNGYRFTDDETKIKVEPLELGDEAYKRLWPDAIWPGTTPKFPPISLITVWIAEYHADPGVDLITGEDLPSVSFIMPHEIEVALADNLGEHFSYYGDARFIQEDYGTTDITSWVMLKGWLMFNDLFGLENKLNLQIGSVGMHTIGLFNARDEQGLPFQGYLMNSMSMPGLNLDFLDNYSEDLSLRLFDGNSFVIQPQTGIEFNGFTRHLLYYGGIINGNIKNPNGSEPEDDVFFMGAGLNTDYKDYYGGLAIKIGGLGFDASTGLDEEEDLSEDINEQGLKPDAEFWRDDSFILSFFGYTGTGKLTVETWNDIRDRTRMSAYTSDYFYDDFWRFGVGAIQRYKDFALSGGIMWGENDNPYGPIASNSVETASWFVESHYFVFPWLVPYVRYESLDYKNLPGADEGVALDGQEDRSILTVGCKFQIRPNILLNLEGYHYTEDDGYDYPLDDSLFLVLTAGF